MEEAKIEDVIETVEAVETEEVVDPAESMVCDSCQ